MNAPRFGIRSAVIALILLPATVGMVAIDASATCQRFVREYITVPAHKQVSKATAMAWAKWRVAHPNWKPKPGAQRIGVPMTRTESIKKVDFACDVVDSEPTILDSLIDPIPPLVPPAFAPPIEEIAQAIPTELAQGTPIPYVSNTPDGPVVPYVPTVPGGGLPPTNDTPPTTDVTPEPSSWLLLATGMGVCSLFWRRRMASLA